ncbi:hypothetical protein MHH81_01540 [Psychrobacillus sp. FSL H8-0484]|uniref:hypothetical protein n=1 Tax=Psychrobacillus sp. FSL H8-0484 TaxID=2921390 RepID=UPI0030F4B717
MKNDAIQELIIYWNTYFKEQNNNLVEIDLREFNGLPAQLIESFDLEYYPEPFYGYLHEDMSKDVFMPLINPGQMNIADLSKLYGKGKDEQIVKLSNAHVKNKHLTWNSKDYCLREIEFEQFLGKKHWRNTKLQQVQKLVQEDIPFLHTIEFFPYHSKSWNLRKSLQQDWIYDLASTKLAINAVEEISCNRLVKYILAIGKVWVDILMHYKDRFIIEDYVELLGPKGGRAHNIYKIRPIHAMNALPIVIYSGASMNLPANDKRAVEILKSYLEVDIKVK